MTRQLQKNKMNLKTKWFGAFLSNLLHLLAETKTCHTTLLYILFAVWQCLVFNEFEVGSTMKGCLIWNKISRMLALNKTMTAPLQITSVKAIVQCVWWKVGFPLHHNIGETILHCITCISLVMYTASTTLPCWVCRPEENAECLPCDAW